MKHFCAPMCGEIIMHLFGIFFYIITMILEIIVAIDADVIIDDCIVTGIITIALSLCKCYCCVSITNLLESFAEKMIIKAC